MTTATSTTRRTALVTGGTAGLGAAIATALAQKGYDVAITERPQLVDGLATTLGEIKTAGGRALAVPLELTDIESIESAAAQVFEDFGHIDVLVNSAAAPLH